MNAASVKTADAKVEINKKTFEQNLEIAVIKSLLQNQMINRLEYEECIAQINCM